MSDVDLSPSGAPDSSVGDPDAPRSTGDRGGSSLLAGRSSQLALAAFLVYLAGAFVYLLVSFDDRYWFIGDDWGLLVDRRLTDPVGWFTPQNTHWSTVPTAVYLVLYKVFGLNSYLPYAATVMVAHLALAGLLRVVMRRVGVSPWVATVAAGTFVLYGTGQQNIWFAIQISMVGSMVAGVAHLILADHDGGFDRRDGLGLAAGAVGLMSSGVGPAMVVMVGIAVLVRRGWRMAALHTAPLAALYGIWFVWQRPLDQGSAEVGGNVTAIARFVQSAIVGVFEGLGQHPIVAALLAALLVGGLIVAWAPLRGDELRRRSAAPVAMAIAAVLVLASAGSQRYLMGAEFARSSRFVAMGTALILPAIAVAASAVIARWRFAAPVVLGLLLVGVPGNIAALGEQDPGAVLRYQAQQEFILGAAHTGTASDVARDVFPYPGEGIHQVTVGFLIEGRATDKIPEPPALPDGTRDKIETRLRLSQGAFGEEPSGEACATYTEPLIVEPQQGDRFAFDGAVSIAHAPDGDDSFTGGTSYSSQWSGRVLTAQLPDQRFRISPAGQRPSFVWCTVP